MEKLTAADFHDFVPIMTEAKCVKVINGRTLILGIVMPEPYGPTKFTTRLVNCQVGDLRAVDVTEKHIARKARSVIEALALNKIQYDSEPKKSPFRNPQAILTLISHAYLEIRQAPWIARFHIRALVADMSLFRNLLVYLGPILYIL